MITVLIVSMWERQAALWQNARTLDLPATVGARILIQNVPEGAIQLKGPETLLYRQGNLGCGGGRQYLVDSLKLDCDDILVFLDDDIHAERSDWLARLVQPIEDGRAKIVGVEGRRLIGGLNTEVVREKPDYVSGGWCAISAEVFLSGCRFDEQFFPNYWEDADLCFQAKKKDFRLLGVGDIGLVHESHGANSEWEWQSRSKFAIKWDYPIPTR